MCFVQQYSQISGTVQQLIDFEVTLSVHWVILPLNVLCTLTCILSGHKALSLPPQLQMSRKPFENTEFLESELFSKDAGALPSPWVTGTRLQMALCGTVCFSLPRLALCTITSITQHFTFRLAEPTLSR